MPSVAVLTEAASARDVLTQAEARDRATRVRQADYDIALDIVAGRSTYRGDVTIRFASERLQARSSSTSAVAKSSGWRSTASRLEPDWNGYRLTLPADVVDAAQ